MAKFIADTKSKFQDLFEYLVSCGKSSKGNDQGPARDVQGDDLGLTIYMPKEDQAGPASDVPPRNAQDQGHIVVIGPGNNTQNQGQPTNIPPVDDAQQGQGLVIIDESTGINAQEQEQDDDIDFEPLADGFVPEERANFSRPPGKKSAPIPKTG
ncbi:uncharacterized protein LOC132060132 isoform X1 [Lycium ferocissimum]|uniref:uncharacterized protein LOC132060132 isoform X1 n=1 Tax=Lycium ferocissimum TaxID=112874 RepID=UPI002815EF1C|nr:uncharacterized protein LOC132060132 isoform X1 [Lycium ferocissimum]